MKNILVFIAMMCLLPSVAVGQKAKNKVTRGFDIRAEPLASGEERNSQANLWVLEVSFKAMRMRYVLLTDPKTGVKRRQLVWYLIYKIVNRGIDQQQDTTDTRPVNKFDPAKLPPIFVPEIILMGDDNGVQKIYYDTIVPEAHAAIQAREGQRLNQELNQNLLNSVEIVGAIPEVTPAEAEKENVVYAVAIWTGVDSQTDYFTIFLNGFSNGYRLVRGPVKYQDLAKLVADGKLRESDQVWDGESNWKSATKLGDLFDDTKLPPKNADDASFYYTVTTDRSDDAPTMVWRKSLIQKYWKPGDEFRQDEIEFKPQDEPFWVYRAEEPPQPKAAKAKPKADAQP